MNIVPQPTFLALDWWALGPVIALTVGVSYAFADKVVAFLGQARSRVVTRS